MYVAATDAHDRTLRVDVVSQDKQTNRARLRVVAEDVPPNGYQLIRLRTASCISRGTGHRVSSLPRDNSLENEFLRVQVDPKTGCITSLFDKRSKTEALAPAVAGVGAPANLARRQALRQPAASLRRQAQAVGRLERGRRLHRAPHRHAASRRSEAHREHAAARRHSRQAHVAELHLHSGHHALRRRRRASTSTCRPTGTRSTSC